MCTKQRFQYNKENCIHNLTIIVLLKYRTRQKKYDILPHNLKVYEFHSKIKEIKDPLPTPQTGTFSPS